MDVSSMERLQVGQTLAKLLGHKAGNLVSSALDIASREDSELISKVFPTTESLIQKLIRYNHQDTQMAFRLTLSYQEAQLFRSQEDEIISRLIKECLHTNDDFHKLRYLQSLATVIWGDNHNGGSLDTVDKLKTEFLTEFGTEFNEKLTSEEWPLEQSWSADAPATNKPLLNHNLIEFKELVQANPLATLKALLESDKDTESKGHFINKYCSPPRRDDDLIDSAYDQGMIPTMIEMITDLAQQEQQQTPLDPERFKDEFSTILERLEFFSLQEEDQGAIFNDNWLPAPVLLCHRTDFIPKILSGDNPGFQGSPFQLGLQLQTCFLVETLRKLARPDMEEIQSMKQQDWDKLLVEITDFSKPNPDPALVKKVENNMAMYFCVMSLALAYGRDKSQIIFHARLDTPQLLDDPIAVGFMKNIKQIFINQSAG